MKKIFLFALVVIILAIAIAQVSSFVIYPKEVYVLSDRRFIPSELDLGNGLFKDKAIIEQLHKVLKEEKMYLSTTLNS